MERELINHPQHYTKEGRKECIVEMEELFGIDACVIFAVCNAYKYNYRCGEKDSVENEIRKAAWYENYAETNLSKCNAETQQIYAKYKGDSICCK